jgi:hypothetical protein
VLFDDVESVEKFYKEYAHDTNFSIHTGQQRFDDNGVVKWKQFLCEIVKLIFMSSALAKASTKLQYYRRRA